MRYEIVFAESVREHLRSLRVDQRVVLLDAIEEQLVYEPLIETRNRKLLRPNPLAPWELRIGDFRVFYEVASDEPSVVRILAVGRKERNRLVIAGKAVKL
ncbi:MAG: type II toxin-antitoxin system RelE/ParE family toxin [Candidatus Latescibacteria bacterium]|nr:type II toxin-antitoxin system RelE/ParE family toxin [Candidatus Latescibacterota bacterium]